jgi:hypothetical protein
VQFTLWPAEALRASLGPGLQLELDGARRTLLCRGRVVWTVNRKGEAMVLENPALGLTVRVRTLED